MLPRLRLDAPRLWWQRRPLADKTQSCPRAHRYQLNNHLVGGRIFDQLLEPCLRATARSVWKPLTDQMKLEARSNGSAGSYEKKLRDGFSTKDSRRIASSRCQGILMARFSAWEIQFLRCPEGIEYSRHRAVHPRHQCRGFSRGIRNVIHSQISAYEPP
jgi:hypothetical protein